MINIFIYFILLDIYFLVFLSIYLMKLKTNFSTHLNFFDRKLGLDLVPRVEGEMVDPDNVSVVELYQVVSRK